MYRVFEHSQIVLSGLHIANYQITKCVLHLDYASKPKNSTEAIYE